VIPLASPVEEMATVPVVVTPIRDPRFAGGGAETMKISRGALLAGALAFDAAEPTAAVIPVAPPPAPAVALPEPPAPSPPPANPFAFESIEASPQPPAPLLASAVVAPVLAAPTVASRPPLDAALPFWLDFLLPVGGAGLFLFIVWIMLLALFIG
jgi:hypothetical protein